MVLSHNYVNVQNILVPLPGTNVGCDASFVPLTEPYRITTGDGVLTVTNGSYNVNTNLLYIVSGVLDRTHLFQDVSRVFVNTQTGYYDAYPVAQQTWTFGNQTLSVVDGTLSDGTHGTLYVEEGLLDVCACVIDWSHNTMPVVNAFYDLAGATCDVSQQTLTNYCLTPQLRVTSGTMNGQRQLIHIDRGTLDVSFVAQHVARTFTQLSNTFVMADSSKPPGDSVPVTNYVVTGKNTRTLVKTGVVNTTLGLVYVANGVCDVSATTTQATTTPVTNVFLDLSSGQYGATPVSNIRYPMFGTSMLSVNDGYLPPVGNSPLVYVTRGTVDISAITVDTQWNREPLAQVVIDSTTGALDTACYPIPTAKPYIMDPGTGTRITVWEGVVDPTRQCVYATRGVMDTSSTTPVVNHLVTPLSHVFVDTTGYLDTSSSPVTSPAVVSVSGGLLSVQTGTWNGPRSHLYIQQGQLDVSVATVSSTSVPVSNTFLSPTTVPETTVPAPPVLTPREGTTYTIQSGTLNPSRNVVFVQNGLVDVSSTRYDVSNTMTPCTNTFMNAMTGVSDPASPISTPLKMTSPSGQTLTVNAGTLNPAQNLVYVPAGGAVMDVSFLVATVGHTYSAVNGAFVRTADGKVDVGSSPITSPMTLRTGDGAVTTTVTSGNYHPTRGLLYVATGIQDVSNTRIDVSASSLPLAYVGWNVATSSVDATCAPLSNTTFAFRGGTLSVTNGVSGTGGTTYVQSGTLDLSSVVYDVCHNYTNLFNSFVNTSTGDIDRGLPIVFFNPYTVVNGLNTTTVTMGTMSSDQSVIYVASGLSNTCVPQTNVYHTYTPFTKTFINTGTGAADASCVPIVGTWTSKNGAVTATSGTLHLSKSLCYVAQGVRDQSAVTLSTSTTSTPYTSTFLNTSGTTVAVDTGFVPVNNYTFASAPGSICTVDSGYVSAARSLIYVANGQWDISSVGMDVSHTYLPVTNQFYSPATGTLDTGTTALVTPWTTSVLDASGRRITTTATSGSWNGTRSLLYVASGTRDISSSQWTVTRTSTALTTGFYNASGGVMDGSAVVTPLSWRDGSNALTVTSGIYSPYNALVYIANGTKDVSAAQVNVTHTYAPYTKTWVSSLTGQIDASSVAIGSKPWVICASDNQIVTVTAGTVNLNKGVLYVERGNIDVSATTVVTNTNTPISYSFMSTDTATFDTTFAPIASYTFTGTNGLIINVFQGYMSTTRGLIYVGNGQTVTKNSVTTAIGNVFIRTVTGDLDTTFIYTTPVNLDNGQNITLAGGLYSATNKLVWIGYGVLNGQGTTVQHTYTDISNVVLHPVTGASVSSTLVTSTTSSTTGGLATVTSGRAVPSANLWYVASGTLDVSNTAVTLSKTSTALSNVIYSTKTQQPASLVPQTAPVELGGGKVLTLSGGWYSATNQVAYYASGKLDVSSSQLTATNTVTPLTNVVWDVCANALSTSFTALAANRTTVSKNGIVTVTSGIGSTASWYIASGTLDVSSTRVFPQHTYIPVNNQMFSAKTGVADATYQFMTPIALKNGQFMNLYAGLWSATAQLMYVGYGVLDVSRSVATLTHTYTNLSNVVVDISTGTVQTGYKALPASTLSTTAGLLTVSGGWFNSTTKSAYVSSATLDISNTLSWVDTTVTPLVNVLIDPATGQPLPNTRTLIAPVTNPDLCTQSLLNYWMYTNPTFQFTDGMPVNGSSSWLNLMYGLTTPQTPWTYVGCGILDASFAVPRLQTSRTMLNQALVATATGQVLPSSTLTAPRMTPNGRLTVASGVMDASATTIYVASGTLDSSAQHISVQHAFSQVSNVVYNVATGTPDTSFVANAGPVVLGNGSVLTMVPPLPASWSTKQGVGYVPNGTIDTSNVVFTCNHTLTTISNESVWDTLTGTQVPAVPYTTGTSIKFADGTLALTSGQYLPSRGYWWVGSGTRQRQVTYPVSSHVCTALSNTFINAATGDILPAWTPATSRYVDERTLLRVTDGWSSPDGYLYVTSGSLDTQTTSWSQQSCNIRGAIVDVKTNRFLPTAPAPPPSVLQHGVTIQEGAICTDGLIYIERGLLDTSSISLSVNCTSTPLSNMVLDAVTGAHVPALSSGTLPPHVQIAAGWWNGSTVYVQEGTRDVPTTTTSISHTYIDVSGMLYDSSAGLPVTRAASASAFAGGTWQVQDGLMTDTTMFVRAGVLERATQQSTTTSMPLTNVVLNQGVVDPTFTAMSNGVVYRNERHLVAYTGLRGNDVWYVRQGLLDVSATHLDIEYRQDALNNVVVDLSGNQVPFQDVTVPLVLVHDNHTLTATTGAFSIANGTVFVASGQYDTRWPNVYETHTQYPQHQVFWDTVRGCVDTSYVPDDGYELVYDHVRGEAVRHWITGDGWASDAQGLAFLRTGSYDVSYATATRVDISYQILDISNLQLSSMGELVDVSYAVDTSFGNMLITKAWIHADQQIMFVEAGALNVVPVPCTCGGLSITDATNNVVLSLPCSAFNAKLGIVKTTTPPVTLAGGLTVTHYYNPLRQCFIDKQGAPIDSIQFNNTELFDCLQSPSHILSVGSFATAYQDFVSYLTTYLQVNRTTSMLDIQQVVTQALSKYRTVTAATIWNILQNNSAATTTTSNIVSGSVTLHDIKCLLQKACETNPFGNRGPGGNVNALDMNNPVNYQPWDGFLPGDMISVPEFNLTLNVNVNVIKEIVGNQMSTEVTQSQNVTHTVNCPLLIVLY